MAFSISGYIKFFTHWINSYIYAACLYSAVFIKRIIMFFIQYSVGMTLTLLGYEELSLLLIKYLDATSAFTYAAILIQILIFLIFCLYFMNSSMDPVVRVNDFSETVDNCQRENLEIQLNQLKDKLSEESEEIVEIQKQFDEELEKSKQIIGENKDLKKLVMENEADKKKIQSLQLSIKEREDEIEIKACELDKLQIALKSAKSDVNNSKSDFKELENKFFNIIKELDVKDVAISDFEDGEKEYKKQLNDKDKEISEKEELVQNLHGNIKRLEKQISDLEHDIEEEKNISHSHELEKNVLEKTLASINETLELNDQCGEINGEDSVMAIEQLKAERLAMMTDVSKIKAEFMETKSELDFCKQELTLYIEKNADLEGKCKELNEKFEALCEQTNELKKTVEKKDIELATISKFFADRENELQTLTIIQNEEIQRLNKEVNSIGNERRQISELNKQIVDLKEEIISNDKQFKHQIATIEEQSHDHYLKMRTAIRECEEHKREKEIYRKKLLEVDMPSKSLKTPPSTNSSSLIGVSLENSNRSDSPGSNKSNDSGKGTTHPTIPEQQQPACMPMPFPPPMMYHGMPQFPMMSTPPFRMQPRHAYSAPPNPYMSSYRQQGPPNALNNTPHTTPEYQNTPPASHARGATGTGEVSFNGQEYVNNLIDKLATKDNTGIDLLKQNKEIV